MPAPLPLADRQRIWHYLQCGWTPPAIARHLQRPQRTIRALCRRLQTQGGAALTPAYRPPAAATPSPTVQQALLLHEQHPSWGAPYLLLRLRQLSDPGNDWPSARTL